jgi:hypothetical protein
LVMSFRVRTKAPKGRFRFCGAVVMAYKID